jgi:hypothetical protein
MGSEGDIHAHPCHRINHARYAIHINHWSARGGFVVRDLRRQRWNELRFLFLPAMHGRDFGEWWILLAESVLRECKGLAKAQSARPLEMPDYPSASRRPSVVQVLYNSLEIQFSNMASNRMSTTLSVLMRAISPRCFYARGARWSLDPMGTRRERSHIPNAGCG